MATSKRKRAAIKSLLLKTKKFTHRVDKYAREVLSKKIVAGPLVRLACERHLADRLRSNDKMFAYIFNHIAADTIINFFEQVLHLPDAVDAAGDPRPFLLLPFQVFIVGSLFGWRQKSNQLRRFRNAYIEAGKGSGKSPLLAGIGLYGLIMDGEIAAEIYSAATSKDQAKILFTDAERIVAASPALREIVFQSVNNLAYAPTGSFFRPVSSEHRQLDGKRPHMVLFDEVQEAPNGLVINKMRAGAKGRKHPAFIEITNSGFDRTSICWQHHEHSRRILEGTLQDERWFAYVCGLDEGDDPLSDESCWPKANPGLGSIISLQYLRDQVDGAKNIPAETNTVLRLNFCVWTQSNTRFFDMTKWHECTRVVSDAELAGRPGYAGLDLGQSDDISALARIWELSDTVIAVRMNFWIPQAALERFKDRPYEEWQRAGIMTITEGAVTDYDQVEREVLELCRAGGIVEVGYDKRFASQLAQSLEGAGLSMIDTPQGFALNEAIKRLSEWVVGEELAHGGNLILSWMADNTVVRTGRAGEKRIDKEASKEKIDGIAALLMAISRFIAAAGLSNISVYESRGLTTLGSTP